MQIPTLKNAERGSLTTTLEIVERFVRGKSVDQSRCEDIIHVSDSFIAVIDGSSIKGRSFGDKTSGRFIAEIIDAALFEVPPMSTIIEGTQYINQKIRKAIGYADSSAVMNAGKRPAASCIFISRQREEVWTYGDTLLSIDGVHYDLSKAIDKVTTAARCAFVRAELLAGKKLSDLMASTADLELIEPLLDRQQICFLNNPHAKELGYGNIDGADEVLHFSKVLPIRDAKTIILASDGYPVVLPTLSDSEAELQRVLQADPLMVNEYPQVKGLRPGLESFDDRAYIKLERK